MQHSAIACWDLEAVGTWLSSSLRRRSGDRLDVNEERLDLRRLRVGVTDERRQRVRAEALLRRAHEPPVQRDADDVNGLAVAHQRLDALGDDRLGLDRAALRPDADHAAGLDALLLRQHFADLDEKLRLERGIDPIVLGPIME